MYYNSQEYDDVCCDFAEPYGKSALRKATKKNPRNRPCSSCGRRNALTLDDVALGYQCDVCAEQCEKGF